MQVLPQGGSSVQGPYLMHIGSANSSFGSLPPNTKNSITSLPFNYFLENKYIISLVLYYYCMNAC